MPVMGWLTGSDGEWDPLLRWDKRLQVHGISDATIRQVVRSVENAEVELDAGQRQDAEVHLPSLSSCVVVFRRVALLKPHTHLLTIIIHTSPTGLTRIARMNCMTSSSSLRIADATSATACKVINRACLKP